MGGYSLMPSDLPPVGGGFRLPGPKTRRVLAGSLTTIALSVAGTVYTGGQAADTQRELNNLTAEKQQVELKTTKLRKELGDLQGAGGADRLNLVKDLLKSRMDWKQVLLGISESAPPGLTLDQFAASTPASGTTASGAGGTDVQLSGLAPTKAALTRFIRGLERRDDVIEDVSLRSVSTADDDSAAAGKVQFAMNVVLVAPPAAPGANAAGAPSTPPTTGTDNG